MKGVCWKYAFLEWNVPRTSICDGFICGISNCDEPNISCLFKNYLSVTCDWRKESVTIYFFMGSTYVQLNHSDLFGAPVLPELEVHPTKLYCDCFIKSHEGI